MALAMTAWFRYTKKRLLVALMVLSLLTAVFGQRLVSPLRSAVHMLIAPLGDAGMYMVTSLKAYSGSRDAAGLSTAEIRQLVQDNEQLRRQLDEMEWRLSQGEARHRQEIEAIQGIRSSFGPHGDLPCELIPARVIAADSLPYSKGRLLNQGSYHGAAAGGPVLSRLLMTDCSKEMPPQLAVVTASALVGRLDWAGPFTSRVQLITDSNFALRGKIRRQLDPNRPRRILILRERAAADERLTKANNLPVPVLAVGDGQGYMVAEAAESEKIEPGDWLTTADDDPYLRTEVRVGAVEEVRVKPDDRLHVRLRVRPFVDLSSLRNVFIVYWKPP